MRNRKVSSIVFTGAVLAIGTLTACSTVEAGENCEPRLSAGALSQNISVNGSFGAEPDISIPADFTVGGAQSYVIEKSSDRSRVVDRDSVVTINYALFDSETGKAFEQSASFTDGSGHDFVPVLTTATQGAFLDSLECAAPGDRIITVFSPEEATAFAGSLELPEGTNIVGLVDVHEVSHLKSEGKVKNLPSGFPGVVTDKEGMPGIVIAPGPDALEQQSAVRVTGHGDLVTSDDAVVANFLQVTWGGDLVENTWQTSGPRYLGTEAEPAADIRSALTGAKVGAQMVYLVPVEGATTNIYVVDILAAG